MHVNAIDETTCKRALASDLALDSAWPTHRPEKNSAQQAAQAQVSTATRLADDGVSHGNTAPAKKGSIKIRLTRIRLIETGLY